MMNNFSLSSPNAKHEYRPQLSPFPPASTKTQCDYDLLKAKVAHLENERVNLSIQIQKQFESDRSTKIQIQSLDNELKNRDNSVKNLTRSLEEMQDAAKSSKEGKEEQFATILSLNGRIDLQTKAAIETENLWSKMTNAKREIKRLEEDVTATKQREITIENEKEDLRKEMMNLQEIIQTKQKEMTILRLEIEVKCLAFKDEKLILENININLEDVNTNNSSRLASLVSINEELSASIARDKENFLAQQTKCIEEIKILKQQQNNTNSASYHLNTEESVSNDNVEYSLVINDLKSKLLQSEAKRKQLHNTLQELRGNIRVFVRCRPFLSGDKDEYTAAESDEHKDPNVSGCVMFHQDGGVSLAKQLGSRDKPQVYNFDQAYQCNSTQEEVFHDVSDLVQSSLDGYKVCVFSYGQTGSGKTHTMSGDKQGKFRGIIPRSVEQIIERVMCMREDGWEVVVNTSMLEIYNEELRDILGGGTPSTASHNDKDKGKLKISNLQGFVTIAGLTAIELDTKDLDSGMNQLEMLLERASKSRMTASTAMNEHSSRSHALFMLDIEAKHPTNSTVLRGGLRLVDLAGSERLDRTGTSNDATRLKETVNINKSLSCLADVFVALGNKASHIPYRNSKLTMALQDCLSGDGKALMFVNVSPTQASSQETLCSLRFASQVSQVELGKATKTVYNLPPPPLHVNKTTENQKDIKNDIQKISLNDSICDVDKNKVLTEKDKSLNVGVGADKFKGAARGAVKNLKNVPSKVVRTIKTTQNKAPENVNIDQNVPYINDQAERLDNNSIMIEGVLYTRNTPPELAPEVQQVSQADEHGISDASHGPESETITEPVSTDSRNKDILNKNTDILTKNVDISLNISNIDVPPSWNSSIIDEYYCPTNTYNQTNNNDNHNNNNNNTTTTTNNNDNILCPRVLSNPLRGSSRVTTAKRLAPSSSLSNMNNSSSNQNSQNINPSVNTHLNTSITDSNAPFPKRSRQTTVISNTNNINSISKTSSWK